jgi:hypothetical protein
MFLFNKPDHNSQKINTALHTYVQPSNSELNIHVDFVEHGATISVWYYSNILHGAL